MSLQLFGTVARGKCSHVVTAFWTDYASGVARPFSVLFGMGPGIFFQEEVLDETAAFRKEPSRHVAVLWLQSYDCIVAIRKSDLM